MRLRTIGILEAELHDYKGWYENVIENLPLSFLRHRNTSLFVWPNVLNHYWGLFAFEI